AAIQSLAAGATLTDTFTVYSADGTDHDVAITITGINDAPTVAIPSQDQAAVENAAFVFSVALNAFEDVDGDNLAYGITLDDGSALPTWLSFDATTRTLSGTPTLADVGMIVLKVTADDGKGGVVSDEFTLTVKQVNTLPTVVITPPDPGTGEPSPPVDGGTPDPSTGDPGEEQTTQPPRTGGGDPVENGPSAEAEGSVDEAPAEPGSETSVDKEVVEEAVAQDDAAGQEADTATEQGRRVDSSADSNGIGLRSGQGKLLDIGGFVKELDEQRELIHERDYFQHTVVGSTMTVTTGLSVGYVVWMIRGGVLLSSLLSSLPAWRWVDPLPVLASLARDSEDDEDDESLETIVDGGEEETESEPDADDDKTELPEKAVDTRDE
ncbi:MAG: putative Ig domain-containing protein, partial [Gammaproteobacteria bacterium]